MQKQRQLKKEKEKDMTPTESQKLIDMQRQKVRERVQKHRQQKKEQAVLELKANEAESSSYSNKATLSKAKKKVERALPSCPTRKKIVLMSLFNDLDENERDKLVNVLSPLNKSTRKSERFDKLVKDISEFYERDDVSRMSPKMRDVKKYTNNQTGTMELMPTRHMIMTVREAYALFIEEIVSKQEGIEIEMMCFP